MAIGIDRIRLDSEELIMTGDDGLTFALRFARCQRVEDHILLAGIDIHHRVSELMV